MSKAEKRRRQKEGRRARIEAQVAAHKSRRRRRLIVNFAILAVIIGSLGFLLSRQDKKAPDSTIACGGSKPERKDVAELQEPPVTIDVAKKYSATIETSCGTIVVELAVDTSPKTANSFVFLARQGFYDGLVFHRVVKGFAIQGGDPAGDGSGGPGYQVVEAPPVGTKYTKGLVAMAKAGNDPTGTSGSQFFIVPGEDAGTLPAEYAVLGRVTSGDDVLAKIEAVETKASASGEQSVPTLTIYIESIKIRER